MRIRVAADDDAEALWAILKPVLRAGETYALDRDMPRADALAYWMASAHETFVAEDDAGRLVGTAYLRPNLAGGGAHVANAGFMTAAWAGGRGVARALAEHILAHARERGYLAMQFNCVVATNTRAIALWQGLGFQVMARLPGAFRHPVHGLTDTLIMHRLL